MLGGGIGPQPGSYIDFQERPFKGPSFENSGSRIGIVEIASLRTAEHSMAADDPSASFPEGSYHV